MLKPTLYAERAAGDLVLLGGRCICGYTFFPMQTYGCERCGRTGSDLAPTALAGRGRLLAMATVHSHTDPRRPTPFTVGTIALDDGPVIRTLLTEPVGTGGAIPTRVVAVLVPVTGVDGEPGQRDLRFAPEEQA